MPIQDLVRSSFEGNAANDLAEAFDIEPAQANVVMDHVLPELAWGLERNTFSRGGLADLLGPCRPGDMRTI